MDELTDSGPKPSGCIAMLSPGVAAVNALMNANAMYRLKGDSLIQQCPDAPGPLSREAQLATDQKMLCELMCCCANDPNIISDGSQRYQSCVAKTISVANKVVPVSRYRPEVTYDMTQVPPMPLTLGEIFNDSPDRRGRAEEMGIEQNPLTRIPDIIAVKDPNLPPTQDNIDLIYEMKFKGDGWRKGQQKDEETIAGDPQKLQVLTEDDCNCGDRKNTSDPVLLPMAERRNAERLAPTQADGINWGAIGKGALAVGAGVAVVAAFASGVGEVAAAGLGLITMATK